MASTTNRRKNAANRDLAGHNGFSLISNQQLLAFYKGMLESSVLEKTARAMPATPRFPAPNPELYASAVACCMDLQKGDVVLEAGGSVVLPYLRKARLAKVISGEARSATATGRRSNSIAVLQTALATAEELRAEQSDRIVVVFAQGVAEDAAIAAVLTRAVKAKLPILFVLLTAKAKAAAEPAKLPVFPRLPADGEDAVALYRAASESIQRIRRGNGPALIDCLAWQDPDTKIRGPIAKMEAYLKRKKLYRESLRSRTLKAMEARLAKALQS